MFGILLQASRLTTNNEHTVSVTVATELSTVVQHSTALLPVYRKVTEGLCELAKLAVAQIDGLMESNVRLTTEGRAVYGCVSRVVTTGFNYIDKVDDFVWYAQQISDIEASVRQGTCVYTMYMNDITHNTLSILSTGDLQPLQYLLFQLRKHLTKATSLCGEFQTACKEAVTSCNQDSRAQFRRRVMQARGGTVAAGVIAGNAIAGVATGVALSVAAGLFTFGVGTIVGLAITAGATAAVGAVAGTGIAVGTDFAARHLRTNFGQLATAFNSLSEDASQLSSNVERVDFQLQRTADEMNNNYCHDHQMLENICIALNNLRESYAKLCPVTSSLREKLREADNQLRAKLLY